VLGIHYKGIADNGKQKFSYHQQTRSYAETKLRELKQNLSIREESNTVAIKQKMGNAALNQWIKMS
jgi:hypothetical protein